MHEDGFYLTALLLPPSPVLKSPLFLWEESWRTVRKAGKELVKTQVPRIPRTAHLQGEVRRAGLLHSRPPAPPRQRPGARGQSLFAKSLRYGKFICFFIFKVGHSLLLPVTRPPFLLIPVLYLATLDKLYGNVLQIPLLAIIFDNN